MRISLIAQVIKVITREKHPDIKLKHWQEIRKLNPV
jgi:hypothetical protein